MTRTVPDPEVYRLAFEEGRAAVNEQVAVLAQLRERAGSLVTLATVVAGLGAGLAVDDGRGQRLDEFGVAGATLAVLGFLLVVWTAARIWLPMDGTFVRDAGAIVNYTEGKDPCDLAATHRDLAIHLGNNTLELSGSITDRLKSFSWALAGLGALVVGLTAMILDVAK